MWFFPKEGGSEANSSIPPQGVVTTHQKNHYVDVDGQVVNPNDLGDPHTRHRLERVAPDDLSEK